MDLDWFSQADFSTKELLAKVSKLGKFELLNEEQNTLEGILDKTKVSFMTYPYPLLSKPAIFATRVSVACPLDIALMKLTAISDRNTKKDFIDLYWYLQNENTDLLSLFAKMNKKFKGVNYNFAHICKALVYFKEADAQPMPKMIGSVDWEKIKKFIVSETRKMVV